MADAQMKKFRNEDLIHAINKCRVCGEKGVMSIKAVHLIALCEEVLRSRGMKSWRARMARYLNEKWSR